MDSDVGWPANHGPPIHYMLDGVHAIVDTVHHVMVRVHGIIDCELWIVHLIWVVPNRNRFERIRVVQLRLKDTLAYEIDIICYRVNNSWFIS